MSEEENIYVEVFPKTETLKPHRPRIMDIISEEEANREYTSHDYRQLLTMPGVPREKKRCLAQLVRDHMRLKESNSKMAKKMEAYERKERREMKKKKTNSVLTIFSSGVHDLFARMFGELRYAPIPIIFGIVFTINLVVVYIMAVINDDVDPILPYLSSAADRRPQSCIFAILTNISAMLSFAVILLRYHIVALYFVIEHDDHLNTIRANNLSMISGIIACTGMFIIANVQETALTGLHLFAAFMTFLFGIMYMGFQTFASYNFAARNMGTKFLFYFRLVLTVIATFSFLAAIICGVIASSQFHAVYPNDPIPRPWNRKLYQPGTEMHIISASFEWIVAVLHCVYLVSMSRDMEFLRIRVTITHEIDEAERIYILECNDEA
ncbi:unnamed protein product [Caenorhabditis bovis]|uniref:CWH43-like N-terminal domain-containing protein n=1 Tax=Caenorhabditis bovis TaxID=2654633 RepID=A0A8S1EER4_9PELO|nr:unnamed protein product [Caenorhabditis bovis]